MFKFALQPVLEFRQSVEERILLEFSGRARQLELEKAKVEGLREKKAQLTLRFALMQRGNMKVDDISYLFSYIEKIKEDEKKKLKAVQIIKGDMEEKRKELLEAVKKRKVIEVLRDRQMEEYRGNFARKERERLDAFGIDQFKREESKEDHHRL